MINSDVWKEYKKNNDIALRNIIIENSITLVKIQAGRLYNYYGGAVDYDDIVSYGILGLIDSIDKFDETKGVKFETYAPIRIRGAIIDSLRKLDWVPRSLRKKSKEIQDAISKLENRLGRSPNNEEIAKYMEITLKELENTLSDTAIINVDSLEGSLYEKSEMVKYENYLPQDLETPEENYLKHELTETLASTINYLIPRERDIIQMYYYDELTYKEIGHILGISESRVSQIHSKAIITIRNTLKKIDNI